MSYHNTVPESGEILKKYQRNSHSQEEKVLIIFEHLRWKGINEASAEKIHSFFDHHTPITSIRRSITNLSERERVTDTEDMHNIIFEPGKLEMTGNRVKGKYGRNINTWRLTR